MFPGEDSAVMSHLNLTINNIEKLEYVVRSCRYIILGPIQTLRYMVRIEGFSWMAAGVEWTEVMA